MEEIKKQRMESLFCPYELALELKELGFDEISLFYYDTVYEGNPLSHCPHLLLNSQLEGFENEPISAPLWQQAFRFFREKYGLHYIICKNIQMDGYGYREVTLIPYMEENENTIFKTYEEAEVECLVKLIKIAKKQNVK